MNLDRRRLIQGGLVLAGGLILPISLRAEKLTDVDRIVLHALHPFGKAPDFVPRDVEYVLERVDVDERLMERMNLRSIAGIKIKVLRNQPTRYRTCTRYICYYHAHYNQGIAGVAPQHGAGRGCWLPATDLDAWVKREKA